ncbi:MAG: TIGR00730 family Rossman fold protein [Parcubacteria group bacterium]|nr:TIGR00730 family Rossman fold protein [Parcubacteria group bacterium]
MSDKDGLNVPAAKLPHFEKPIDFRASFHWRVFRIMAEFVDGFQFLADFKKTVTFFGSARFDEKNKWYAEARKLASFLAKENIGVISGGGPGIMEAANRGAAEAGGDSIGLNIKLPYEQRINPWVKKAIAFHYFFVRKVMLSYSAQAYVFFPGGYGTLDEVFEIITLIQTKKVSDTIPVILVGKEFWQPICEWIDKALYEKFQTIDKEDMNIYKLVDTAEEALEIAKNAPSRHEF